jgi:hypothetical protein
MANRPSHGLQQRILAFVAAKPGREVIKNGSVENCTTWIGKRLGVAEKAVIAELDNMERDGLVKVNRGVHRGITQIQVVRDVDPEEWAVAEMSQDQSQEAPVPLQLPPGLDLRQLADDMLLAALDVLGSSNDVKAQRKHFEEEMAVLTETNNALRAELSHVKAERDTNIKSRKVAEQVAHDQKNLADQARSDLAEREADLADVEVQVAELEEQIRVLNMGHALEDSIGHDATEALMRMISEQNRK